MFNRIIPWQFLAKRASRAYGFANPMDTLARVRKFSQPSETNEPIELLRAGFAFHSRGLVNTKAIQNNLDWVWPYWVTRQFDPDDASFVPRAFSFSHINLTHRNWTAVGLPGRDEYGIVDPRGLVTPFHDSWSIDFWIVDEDGRMLFPSQLKEAEQRLDTSSSPRVVTRLEKDGMQLDIAVQAAESSRGQCRIEMDVTALSERGGYLIVALRPYNPEGVQFIDKIQTDAKTASWRVNGSYSVRILDEVEGYQVSNYEHGDVSHKVGDFASSVPLGECPAGMATAAAYLRLEPGAPRTTRALASPEEKITVDATRAEAADARARESWHSATERCARLEIADAKTQELYEQACSTLVLLSPHDIYPGPYTYRRFWFRDACLIAHALLCIGKSDTCRKSFERFPPRQTVGGYYLSQEGEWDSNGQVLWIYDRYEQLTGESIPQRCYDGVAKASRWIESKRLSAEGTRMHGLLPAGFSAEHFGPNDFYYWDDLWAVAGQESASRLALRRNDDSAAQKANNHALDLRRSVETSIEANPTFQRRGSIPASPNRRMDSGAVGSLVADYPLQLFDAGDERVRASVEWILKNCFVKGAFFQDMIHSGLNVYLTLDVAQSLLRLGDDRWYDLLRRCGELASPTGQWPEAIHPGTLGGCMGDGQHAWAAAEWIMLVRNAMLREERDALVIGSGVLDDWIPEQGVARFGYTATPYGEYRVSFRRQADGRLYVEVERRQERGDPSLRLAVPGFRAMEVRGSGKWSLEPMQASGSAATGAPTGRERPGDIGPP